MFMVLVRGEETICVIYFESSNHSANSYIFLLPVAEMSRSAVSCLRSLHQPWSMLEFVALVAPGNGEEKGEIGSEVIPLRVS